MVGVSFTPTAWAMAKLSSGINGNGTLKRFLKASICALSASQELKAHEKTFLH